MEQKLRETLVEYGRKLVDWGLVQGTWGNVSVRLDENYMLTTPSGIDYARLTPEDMVKVSISNLSYEGKVKPTSEKDLHAAIYQSRPDVGAVIHTHAKYSCAFAAAHKDMPVVNEYRKFLGESIKLATYGRPGTKKLAQNTVDALGDGAGAIMSNHGMVAVGKDIESAFEICEKIEENGRIYILTR